ncbi:conserved hypothetical protein, partial [Ricinus communis]
MQRRAAGVAVALAQHRCAGAGLVEGAVAGDRRIEHEDVGMGGREHAIVGDGARERAAIGEREPGARVDGDAGGEALGIGDAPAAGLDVEQLEIHRMRQRAGAVAEQVERIDAVAAIDRRGEGRAGVVVHDVVAATERDAAVNRAVVRDDVGESV